LSDVVRYIDSMNMFLDSKVGMTTPSCDSEVGFKNIYLIKIRFNKKIMLPSSPETQLCYNYNETHL